jgi:hypothetical protein
MELVLMSLSCFVVALGGEPVRVVPESIGIQARQPQAAVDGDGTIYVAFGADNAVYCSVSRDGGASFGAPVAVGRIEKLALGRRRGPRIVAQDKTVVITAIGHREGDVVAWRSTDGGETWQASVKVNDSSGSAGEGLHAMSADRNGRVYCVWLDHRNRRTEIFGAQSTDGGQTWERNVLIYRSPSGNVCECCHPTVAHDIKGTVYVMWRNSLEGARDMFFSTSKNGQRFGPAQKLGRGTWPLDACPMDGGALAIIGPGKFETVWRRGQEVFRARQNDAERRLGSGEQPWAAADPEGRGAYFIWLSRRHGQLWLVTPGKTAPKKLADQANDPVLAAPIVGDGPVVALWESGNDRSATILAAVVSQTR